MYMADNNKKTEEVIIDRGWMLEEYKELYRRAKKFSTPDVCAKILGEIGKLMKVDKEVKDGDIMIFNEDVKPYVEPEEEDD